MNSPQCFEVNYPEAQNLADLFSLRSDFDFVDSVLKRLWENLNNDQDDEVLQTSLWTTAIIGYFRCFATGKRFGLTEKIFAGLDGAVEFHKYYKNLRDKHVAHSVNANEQIKVAVCVSGEPPNWELAGVCGLITKNLS